MRKCKWKQYMSGALVAVMLSGSLPDFQAKAAALDGADYGVAVEETWGSHEGMDTTGVSYQYVIFHDGRDDIEITVPKTVGVLPLENVAASTVYRIDTEEAEEFVFEAAVRYGYKLEIPDDLADKVFEKRDRNLVTGKWVYHYGLTSGVLSTTEKEPLKIRLTMVKDVVPVKVSGSAVVEGLDEDGMAQLGSEVSIEVTQPGYTLAMHTEDAQGNAVYMAMELDSENKYVFTATEGTEFIVADPDHTDYAIIYGDARKAKITGTEGIRLKSLASSAQGYKEIVLNFTTVQNGSDGTEEEDVYYEVKVKAAPKEGETVPAGSGTLAKYFYIPKQAGASTQSKSIQVNNGDLSASTACTYEFTVRMVLIDKETNVPGEDVAVTSSLPNSLAGNAITKTYSTKNLYYEDKLGFTKKNAKIYSGQENLLAGVVKYSKNASYIHDLTAVAYDSRGGVCNGITCSFQNDNDELYLSADTTVKPGQYSVVVYAGIGEEDVVGTPQGGSMYQANTSFTLTVQAGIYYIETAGITKQAAVNNKNITFSAVPVGYSYHNGQKAKTQKFSYEIKSAVPDKDAATGYTITEPVDKVRDNISVNKSGKVTVKRGYYVDPDTSKNHIAIIIKAADYAGNETTATAYVQIVDTMLVPTKIYLANSQGNSLGTKVSIDKANGAKVVVLDQNGNNMNQYVTITPADNAKGTAKAYVTQSASGDSATLNVRKTCTVTIKATSKDGGKKSKSLKVKILMPTFATACYYIHDITSDGFSVDNITRESGLVTYSAPKGAVIKFQQGAKLNGVRYYNNDWFDWDYELKDGKLVKDGDYWLITPTAKTAELKVWLKSDSSRMWKVKFTNKDWKKTYEASPGVKLVSGKLYSNKYTNIYDVTEYDEDNNLIIPEQELTYRYEYGSYDAVKIAGITKDSPNLYLSDFDPEHRTFKLKMKAGNDFKTGSYQFKVAFYRNGTLMCKPATITVKVNKASKVKVTSAYTLNTAQTDSVKLKCTPGEFVPDFDTRLLNANEGGKANDFNKYFELAYVTNPETNETSVVIRFKEDVTETQKEQLKGKSLTGYVKYSYYFGLSRIKNATSKVTIKIK
ncbi:MAG: hypothetical protein K2O32_01740 [Acetatifactor sp.]|nr:hypothetical protein [Acetatifactor sp.]